MNQLTDFMHDSLGSAPTPAGLTPLLEKLVERFGQALTGVVLYGSCRRKADVTEGLVDLLVVVSGYRAAFGAGGLAMLNWLLPPNVFYMEAQGPDGVVRCKYAVVSLKQFRRRMKSRVDHYFWARFCQPTKLVLGDKEALAVLAAIQACGARSFATRIAPRVSHPLTAHDFWITALTTTYRCELRPEPPDNARMLIAHDPDYWRRLTALLATEQPMLEAVDPDYYRGLTTRPARLLNGLVWQLRRASGKLFNLARLFKAAGTFSNGIDYIVWKVERHSGIRIEPTQRMRRHPRLAAWGLAWRMWRQGGLR